MEVKKSPKADLENKKGLFLEIGLVIALAITGIAFALSSEKDVEEYEPVLSQVADFVEEDEMVRTDLDKTPPPPEEQQEKQQTIIKDAIKLVKNETILKTEVMFTEDADEFDSFDFDMGDVEEEINEEDEVYYKVEKMPGWGKNGKGDIVDFRAWVMEHVKYPQIALENNIQGNVLVQFVVGPDGMMRNIKILQSPDKTLSDAVIDVLKKGDEETKKGRGWKPGEQRGKAVKVSFTLPISFKIS